MNRNNQAQYFTKEKIQPLIDFIKHRYFNQPIEFSFFESELNRLADDWENRIRQANLKKYDELLVRPSDKEGDDEDWVTMQSMREVDTNTFIQIKGYR